MKSHWIAQKLKYDGHQLRPLFAYENYHVLGDSIVSWVGACNIAFSEMKDLEDVLAKSPIRGDMMLHFIIEVFRPDLYLGVSLQRLFAGMVLELLNEEMARQGKLHFFSRRGDDIYSKNRKLSISIASVSAISTQIHFAMNIVNTGTPVKTCALTDFNIKAKNFAQKTMNRWVEEYNTIVIATQKVRPLG